MVAAIIDSHPVFLNGLTQFLQGTYPSIQIIKSLNISAFESSRGELKPDFIILGINNFFKPREMKTFEMMARALPATATIMFYDELNMVLPFLKSGAKGFIAKKGDTGELVDCLTMIISGKRYLNNEVFEWIVRPTS